MFKILKKEILNNTVSMMKIHAPYISKKALPGQFVIIRIDEFGERFPLTIFDYDRNLETIDIIYQKVGTSTMKLDKLNEQDYILDIVGPLGKASELENYNKTIVVSGGVGGAIACPLARRLKELGTHTEIISGFRTKDLVILEKNMREIDNNLVICTDDGSYGRKALVTEILQEKLNKNKYDLVVTVGPIVMMKAVCELTKKYNIKTIASMIAIMIDGTGMCGGCRLTVDGQVKFACIDGPDFDGHLIDFDEAITRNNMYRNEEKISREKYCNLKLL